MEPLETRRARFEPGDEILRQSEVLQITKLSRTTIWRMRKEQRFPEPLDISVGVKGWLRSDIERWMRGLSSS